MLWVLAILGAVTSWAAAQAARGYGLPANVAELAPALAIVSACLWAGWYLSIGASRRQLWLAAAPLAWVLGGLVGAHVSIPGLEQPLMWLPKSWQNAAAMFAALGYSGSMALAGHAAAAQSRENFAP